MGLKETISSFDAPRDRRVVNLLTSVVSWIAVTAISIYAARQVVSYLDPDAKAKAEAEKKRIETSRRLQNIFSNHDREEEYDSEDEDENDAERQARRQRNDRPRLQDLHLNQYEQNIAMEVVAPNEIPLTFEDIGGLGEIIEDLRESVIYPLLMPHLYSGHSSLLTAPSGVLLHGPPGCGKTMLAKALARESGACFINLHISTLTEKWYGDSNKLVAAVFSLARKLQPSIVFIDEIDAVLGQRRSGEHEASGQVKAEFMTHWDGLTSATADKGMQRICILGATNRIQDIDEAILRRMPKKFPISLPNASQRRSIFEITLRDTKLDRTRFDNGEKAFDLNHLVRLSAGMSGSDIKGACRDAAMVPFREYIRKQRASGSSVRSVRPEAVRGLQTDDFFGRRSVESRQISEKEKKRLDVSSTREDDARSQGSGSTEEVEEFDEAGTPPEEFLEEVERR